jgi:hypothetical protein
LRPAGLILLAMAGCGAPAPATPDLAHKAEPQIGALRDAEGARPIGASGRLADGTPLVARADGRWQPLAPPPGLDANARLLLDDGAFWAWMSFAGADGLERARWVSPAHSRDELARRLQELGDEAAHLPPAELARVKPLLPLIASISVIEGDFGDPATHPDDRAGSIGIFQWAAGRSASDTAGSSLARFFVDLQRRAAAGTEPLYVRAWKQCRARGLDLRRGALVLGKRRASGGEVEQRLARELGSGALRTYQLVAAADWIDQIRATVIRPGARGALWLGHGYAESDAGRRVVFRDASPPLELRAEGVTTVGELFPAPAALALAVNLGVNRPSWVAPALWRSLTPDPPSFPPSPAALWPIPATPDPVALAITFRREALALYPPAEREKRARRLATALLLE